MDRFGATVMGGVQGVMGNTIGGTDFMSAYTDPSLQGMPVLLQPPALQPTVQSVHPPTVQSHPQTSVEATAVQPRLRFRRLPCLQ